MSAGGFSYWTAICGETCGENLSEGLLGPQGLTNVSNCAGFQNMHVSLFALWREIEMFLELFLLFELCGVELDGDDRTLRLPNKIQVPPPNSKK